MIALIDAGPAGGVLLEYLEQQEIDQIDLVLISHADADHIRGLLALLGAGTRIATIYLNSDASKDSELWRDLLYELDHLDETSMTALHIGLTRGQSFDLADTVSLYVAAPRPRLAGIGAGGRDEQGREVRSNSASAVVVVASAGENVALLAGDLDDVGLAHMLDTSTARISSLQAPVLVFPHHGGHSSHPAASDKTKEFAHTLVATVDPKLVVFSTGNDPSRNLRPETIDGVFAGNPRVMVQCTRLSGHCVGQNASLASTDVTSRTTKDRKCAGTVVIDLASGAVKRPSVLMHQRFIRGGGIEPMCLQRDGVPRGVA